MRGRTTIEASTPERLVVRRRSGRTHAYLFLAFGGVLAVLAIVEPGAVRWAAAGLAALNLLVAWLGFSQTTITFDRSSGEVECAEQRPLFTRRAVLPLKEFTGAHIKQAPGNKLQTRLGLETRKGVFIPIEPSFTPGARNEIANAIDDWLNGGERAAEAPDRAAS